jgi:threonine dehydrogenase-like Zn-dependent dehydrogenase
LTLVGLSDKPITITDGTRFSFLQQQVLGHYGSEPADVTTLVALTARGRLDFSKSVSATVPLAEAERAVQMLERKEGDPIRIVLVP